MFEMEIIIAFDSEMHKMFRTAYENHETIPIKVGDYAKATKIVQALTENSSNCLQTRFILRGLYN